MQLPTGKLKSTALLGKLWTIIFRVILETNVKHWAHVNTKISAWMVALVQRWLAKAPKNNHIVRFLLDFIVEIWMFFQTANARKAIMAIFVKSLNQSPKSLPNVQKSLIVPPKTFVEVLENASRRMVRQCAIVMLDGQVNFGFGNFSSRLFGLLGFHCDSPIQEQPNKGPTGPFCERNPCYHGGTCVNQDVGCKCKLGRQSMPWHAMVYPLYFRLDRSSMWYSWFCRSL